MTRSNGSWLKDELLNGEIFYTWKDVLQITEKHPGLAQINTGVRLKEYREVDDRR